MIQCTNAILRESVSMLCVRSLETCNVCCHKHNWLTSYIYIEVSCDMKVFVYSPELKLDGKINQANSAMFFYILIDFSAFNGVLLALKNNECNDTGHILF